MSVAIILTDLGRGWLYFVISILCLGWGLIVYRRRLANQAPLHFAWRLILFWVMGTHLNLCLKYLIQAPRPWWIHEHLAPLHPSPAIGFGMPSGHAQSAVGIFWLFWWSRRLLARDRQKQQCSFLRYSLLFIAAGWVGLMMWSRVTLNAHSLSQVFMGCSLGLGWGYYVQWTTDRVDGWRWLTYMAFIFSIIGVYLIQMKYSLPPEIIQTITQRDLSLPHSPTVAKVLILSGLSVAVSLFTKKIFDPRVNTADQ